MDRSFSAILVLICPKTTADMAHEIVAPDLLFLPGMKRRVDVGDRSQGGALGRGFSCTFQRLAPSCRSYGA